MPDDTLMPASVVLTRTAVRTGAALWRNRIAFGIAALAVAALGWFQLASAGPAVVGSVNGDCADTTMAAVTTTNDDGVARAAYECLSPSMRSTSEDRWIANLRQHGVPNAQFSRIADHHTGDGGMMVFYSVDAGGQSAGYIVYLDAQGRVRGVE